MVRHEVSTQVPRSEHERPVRQPSSGWQRLTHWPRSHTRLVPQRSLPSSGMPSQSLSKPLQARARGMLTCWQVVPIPEQMVTPMPQAPIWPGTVQGMPAPVQPPPTMPPRIWKR